MDLRDLVKLAGIVTPELLNKLEPTAEVEEADGAGFDQATTRPEPEMMDDPMATMGSDADLSLRRYLKAKGDHVTVDEADLYPDYTVEDVNEAYAAFKEGKYKSDAQRKAVHAAKAEESIEEGKLSDQIIHDSETMSKEDFAKKYGKEMADEYFEATIGAPDYNPAKASAGGPGYASMPQQIKLAGDSIWDKEGTNPPMITITDYEVSEEDGYVSVTVEHDGPMEVYTDSGFEKAVSDMIGMDVEFSEQGMQQDGVAHLEGSSEMESVEVDEPAVDENAFNQAAAAAARANKDSFEFNGKTYKTKMDKSTAHQLDDDVDMIRKLAGLG
jgi:hypothetical protein